MGFPPAMELGGEAFPTARWEPRREPRYHNPRFSTQPRRMIPIGHLHHQVAL